MTPEEKKMLREVYDFMKTLKRFDRIGFDVENAFSRKLNLGLVTRLGTSGVTVGSFTQAVDEGGAATYNVAKLMTGFSSLEDGRGNIITVATYD